MKNSVGFVETQYFNIDSTIELECGKTLDKVVVAYETYGKLNKKKNNAILVCHALTGDAHAAGFHKGDSKPGWWDIIIGPGKALDTDKFFIICSNCLGGCKGTTGPSSINPATQKEYGLDFPVITIKDMVNVQKLLIDSFCVDQLLAVIGGSMGGMQVLQWLISYPNMVKKAIPIATTARSSPQQIAFNEVGRQAIYLDPNWKEGNYYNTGKVPRNGLSVARMIAHITYLSEESMYIKFGRNLQDKDEISYDLKQDFQVESYLHHQGESFVRRFDANSYLYITKAVDLFDLAINNSLIEGLQDIKSAVEVVSVDSDWLYPSEQSKELVKTLAANNVDVDYSVLQSPYGHDAFLLEKGQLNFIVSNFIGKIVVSDLMDTKVPVIQEGASVKESAIVMFENQVTHLPVVDKNNILKGIVTSWDIAKSIIDNEIDLRNVMTTSVEWCTADDSIVDVATKMRETDISCLPVIDKKNKVVGLITIDQISHLISKNR